MTAAGPQLRRAVRVLLIDESDRVLLFRTVNPETGAAFWCPVGGGVEPGEDVRTAAVREVREETGLTDVLIGAEVWHRRHVFAWRGVEWDQRERWFVARVATFAPDRAGHTDSERVDLAESGWRSVEELAATADTLVPHDLSERMRVLLAEGPPLTPVEVGI